VCASQRRVVAAQGLHLRLQLLSPRQQRFTLPNGCSSLPRRIIPLGRERRHLPLQPCRPLLRLCCAHLQRLRTR
jgi:hypothetical protein